MFRDHRELTSQQLEGLAAMVALAVFFHVIKSFLPLWGSTVTPAPYCQREKGTLTIALNMDGQERGVFFMPPGAMISDLMTAIGTTILPEFEGGVGSRRLLSGDKVYLDSVVSAHPVVGKMSAAQSLALDLPMDINKAGLEDLVLVPGIGEKTAAQIIDLRVAKGRFRSLAELKELSGIKEKKFDKLKNYFFAVP